MKSNSQVARVLRQIASAATVMATILQTVAMFTEHEPNTNYFYPGAILPLFALAFAILSALLETVAALILPKKLLRGDIFRSRPIFYPSTVGFLLASLVLASTAKGTLGKVSAVLLFVAAIYTILCGLPQIRRKYKTTVVLLGFAAVAACITLNAYYYFDFSIEMNSPFKVAVQIVVLLIMLSYTGELRFVLGIQKPRTHLILHAWTSALGSLSAVSLPIALLCGVEIRADYTAGAILIFAICLTQHFQLRHLINSSYHIQENTEKESFMENDSYTSLYATPEDLQKENDEEEQ